jgi:hypothetical protein
MTITHTFGILATLLMLSTLFGSAHAASVHVSASITFIRIEKVKVEDQNFSIGLAAGNDFAYHVQRDGTQTVIVIE